ncbi:DsbA family protein [Streptomyces sp. NPDC058045]|uniref:DsbA family protein n=1 Tax=Streptomyces sp. NPDC058045 TaxID=3346311 RepID=UPI0036EE6FDE
MSDNNRRGKRTARERLAAQREREKSREKRRRTLIVSGAVVGVLALAAVGGVIAANSGGGSSKQAGPVVAPQGATGKNGLAIPVGQESAKSTLTIWEDFRCPACKQFEDTYRATIHELTRSGQLKVEYHLATLIDQNMGGSGSLHAANAAACAQQAGKFPAYHDVLYENQPAETTDSFADNAKLTGLAQKVPGLDTPSFRSCVDDGTHNSWVGKSDQAFQKGGFGGTPTILLNGKDIYSDQKNPLTPQKLKQMVQAADKA